MDNAIERSQNRPANEPRSYSFRLGIAPNAQGSALAVFGNTKVLCTATIDTEVPSYQVAKHQGWLTAEYGMLPCATATRNSRERTMSNGRTKEIQRLIGRSLRSCVNLSALQGHRVIIDCDVIQADGGTRTASICGAWLALVQACAALCKSGQMSVWPITQQIAAISVGCWHNTVIVDLDYAEDSHAEVDCNVVMNGQGEFIELQGTAEGHPFTRPQLKTMLEYAQSAIEQIMEKQRAALADCGLSWPLA
ncbi:ribonuclease PH [bacterium]|nr:ribonuclease PH [bacterium]